MRFIVTQKFIFCGHMVREGMFLATAILWSKNVKSINKSAIINHFLVPTAPTKSTVCNSWSPIKGNKCSVLSNFIFISFMCFVFSFLMNSLKQKRCQENSRPENSHPSNSKFPPGIFPLMFLNILTRVFKFFILSLMSPLSLLLKRLFCDSMF